MAGRHFDGDGASARIDDGMDFRGRPPRERPIACASAPLSARRRAASLGRRAVDGLTIAGIGARQRVKQTTPNPAHRPAAKAIVDRPRRPVDRRAILPREAGLQNVNDVADDPPVVGPSRPGLVLGQQRPRRSHYASLNQNSPAMTQALQPVRLESQTDNQLNTLIECGA
jgi:hypothetical protein